MSTSPTTTPSSNAKNNTKGKLRRPLSAYNIYFRSEREVIRAEVNQGKVPSDYSKHVDAALKRLKGKRGAAEFQAVASTIAARWKTLPTEERTKYEKMAEAEMEEYKERKFQYHRTLVKECEMAARGKSQRSSPETLSTSQGSTEKPDTALLSGSLRSQLFMASTPQESTSLASTLALPRFSNNAVNPSFPSSLPGLAFAQRDISTANYPNSLFPVASQNKSYDSELASLRQEILLRERMLLQARQEEKMRLLMAERAHQQALQQAQDEQFLMGRRLAFLQQQQRSSSPKGEQVVPSAAWEAMVRASLQE